MRASSGVVQHQLPPTEARHDLSGQIVRGGSKTAARHDHVYSGLRHLLERGPQILRSVTDDLDHRHVDTQVAQAL